MVKMKIGDFDYDTEEINGKRLGYFSFFMEKIKIQKSDPDFTSAMKICKKRRIGPMRPDGNRALFYKKDMGILARSGFSYDVSKKILSMTQKEFLQLIKLT